MNATVTGALIGGGAAVVGFVASAWNTARTVRASRDVAREQRLWEKRTAVYEALLGVSMRITSMEGEPLVGDFKRLHEQEVMVNAYASDHVRSFYLLTLTHVSVICSEQQNREYPREDDRLARLADETQRVKHDLEDQIRDELQQKRRIKRRPLFPTRRSKVLRYLEYQLRIGLRWLVQATRGHPGDDG